MKALYPGSFDPVTFGHLDIIKRAARLADELVVGVLKNSQKNPIFEIEERIEHLKYLTKDIGNITVSAFSGLTSDFFIEIEADCVIRGLRTNSDFESEFQMAMINHNLTDKFETVFLPTDSKNMYISSTVVKEVISYNGDISSMVPKYIKDILCKRFWKE